MSAFRTDAIRNPLDMQLVDRPFVRGHGLFGHCENFIRIVVSETFADHIFGKKFRGVLDAEFFLRIFSRTSTLAPAFLASMAQARPM